jgi:hypothetical protein
MLHKYSRLFLQKLTPPSFSEAAAQKAADAARKKAEREAQLAAEEASAPAKGKGAGTKTAQKKFRGRSGGGGGLDDALSALDGPAGPHKAATISASGIDNAIDALSIDAKANDQIDRHPERRFKAAYTIFEERRLEEMKDDKTLRRQQKIEQIRKEFDKHPDNPFNQVAGKYNSTREELREIADSEKKKTEARLAGQS